MGAVEDELTAIMNVSLTPELEKFVASEVETGLYQTASEVIRAGLRRLKQEKERLPTGRARLDTAPIIGG